MKALTLASGYEYQIAKVRGYYNSHLTKRFFRTAMCA